MDDGTQAAVAPVQAGKRKTFMVLVAGTAVALLVTGIVVQVLRPASAFPDQTPAVTDANGQPVTGNAKPKQYVARVGGVMVTYDELANECVARHGEEILDSIINRKIIQLACEAKGAVVTEDEVNEEIVRIAKKFNLAVDQWLQMLQAERKISPAQYRRDVIWPMLALRKLAGGEVAITPEELQKAFVRNYGPRVKARAIVFDNFRRATETFEKVRAAPDDFERLAREFSVDPTSRALGGAVPPIRKFGGSPELENAAFKLKPGEISGVVQIGVNQYVILQCEGHTDQIVDDISQVEELLKQELHEEKVQATVAKLFEKVKKQTRVDNYLLGETSGGEVDGSVSGSPIRQTGGEVPAATRSRGAAAGPATGRASTRTAAPQ